MGKRGAEPLSKVSSPSPCQGGGIKGVRLINNLGFNRDLFFLPGILADEGDKAAATQIVDDILPSLLGDFI